jgi:hypothetical protein
VTGSRILLGVSALLLLHPQISEAACGMKPYEFRGEILDKVTRERIANAVIYTFLDNQAHINSNGYETSYPDFATSNNEGRFGASSFFNTNRPGALKGDYHDCRVNPTLVEFVVSAEGYETTRLKIEIATHEYGMDKKTIVLDEPILIPKAFEGAK